MKFQSGKSMWIGLGTAGIVALIIGCGGSGSGSSGGSQTAPPTGNAAVRAMSVGSFQSLNSGIALPFVALVASAPPSSSIKQLAKFSSRYKNYAQPSHSRVATYSPQLGLYGDNGVQTAGGITYHFFTDSAEKNSAGSMVVVSGAGSFDPTSFPETVKLTLNITAGNLPCTGAATIVFNGDSGTNTLQGSINLTRNPEQLSINMTLSPTLQVGGSMSITENNTTVQFTDLDGPLSGDVAGNFTLAPQGYKGTGTCNFNTAAMSLQFTDPTGAKCAVDSSGDLVLTYPGGSTETISNPLTAALLGTGSTGTTSSTATTATTSTTSGTTATTATTSTTSGSTGTTSTTSGSSNYTLTKLSGNPVSITAVSSNGHMVGSIGTNQSQTLRYWATPSSSPQTVQGMAGSSRVSLTSVNPSGSFVGSGYDSTQVPLYLYWASASAKPIQIQVPSAASQNNLPGSIFIQASGRILLSGNIGYSNSFTYVYADSTDTNPTLLKGGYVTTASEGAAAAGVSSDIDNPAFVVWNDVTKSAPATTLAGPVSTSIKTIVMGPNGTIALTDEGANLIYSITGPSYSSAVKLPAPAVTVVNIGAGGVGPTGHILGSVMVDSTSLDNDALIWLSPTSKPINLKTSTTPLVEYAEFEIASGQIIVSVLTTAGQDGYYYGILTPKS